MHTNSTLYARISPQWFSKLRWLWPDDPWQVACELISRQVPTLSLDSSIASPLWPCWVKSDVCLGVTCYLHFQQNDQGLLHATAVTWGDGEGGETDTSKAKQQAKGY